MAKTFTSGEVLTASDVNVNLATFMPAIPTSVSGTGVAYSTTTGLVTLTNATSVAINGVFTSTYLRYVMQYDIPTASTNISYILRMRAAGVSDNTAVYDSQRIVSKGNDASSPQSANILAASGWLLGSSNATTLQCGSIDFFRPATATPTMITGQSFATLNPSTAAVTTQLVQIGGLHRSSTAYDGLTIVLSSGNITGTIKIYAYN
jgi:hypothetical protein